MTDDEREVRELVASWMEASRKGDLSAVLSMMTDDVVFSVPGAEPFGKAEFAAMSKGMADARVDGTAEIRELRVLGDWAFIRNRIEIVVTPPAGPPVRRSGYTLTLLTKEPGGRWRIARDANLVTATGDAG